MIYIRILRLQNERSIVTPRMITWVESSVKIEKNMKQANYEVEHNLLSYHSDTIFERSTLKTQPCSLSGEASLGDYTGRSNFTAIHAY